MTDEKDEIIKGNLDYQTEIRKAHKDFTAEIKEMTRMKGLEMQELLLKRIETNEAHVLDFNSRLKDSEREI